MEILNGQNRGYEADLNVVTYCQNRKETDEKSKFRILIVSWITLLEFLDFKMNIEWLDCFRLVMSGVFDR